MKSCKECNNNKLITEFYKHPLTKDGVMGRCKDCVKKGRKTEHELSMSRKRDSDRYYKNKSRRDYLFASAKERRKRKGYANIHQRTARAIKKIGNRPNICPICSKHHSRIEAHHFDYEQELKIIFACSICHSKLDSGKIKIEDCEIVDLEILLNTIK